jgi:anti-sigma factor RsiW
VDAELAPGRAAEVLAWLRHHPEPTWQALGWSVQAAQLRRAARAMAREAEASGPAAPPMPKPPVARRLLGDARWGWGVAAGLLLMTGVLLTDRGTTPPALSATASPAFVQRAGLAHAAFVPEVRHPVEVAAAEQQHLVQWLSKRLGRPLRVPDLGAQGYTLLGGRLLPGDAHGPSAQFMFEGPGGARLTLYVAVDPQARAPTAFQSLRKGDQLAFYWVDRDLGYVLMADASQPLGPLARSVYEQLAQAPG